MPAPSETSIANAALTLLGERRVNSLDDASKTAKLLKDRFDDVRDDLLRAHSWNFATKRASLAVSATTPAFGYDNAYDLPSDYLRLISVSNTALLPYEVEGRQILTDLEAPLEIVYTRRVEDPVQMDPMFRQALAAALAVELAESITGTSTKVRELQILLRERTRMARVPDGQEPWPSEIEASEWLDSREETGLQRNPPSGGIPL